MKEHFSHLHQGYNWIKVNMQDYYLHEPESEIDYPNIAFETWKQVLLDKLTLRRKGNALQFCLAFCETFPNHAHLCYVTNGHGHLKFYVYVKGSFYNIKKAIQYKNFLKYCHISKKDFLEKMGKDSWVVILPTFNESEKLNELPFFDYLCKNNHAKVLRNSN